MYKRFRALKSILSFGMLSFIAMLALAGCAHSGEYHVGPADGDPVLGNELMLSHDGYRLPVHRWTTDRRPQGVVLALHGFNDYGGAFGVLADDINGLGMHLYSYDQRGFGATQPQGLWAGENRMVKDAITAVELLRKRYPNLPIFLMGKSMGAGVSILAMTHEESPAKVDGSILIAPAVWGKDVMPWYQRLGLWSGTNLIPTVELTVEMAEMIGNRATDLDEILEQQRENPKVQRAARMDTLDGVASLMNSALKRSPYLPGPSLILYGDNDEVIPAEPICLLLDSLPDQEETPWRMALYPGGYHMLTRYSESGQVHRDIMAWLHDQTTHLPSDHEVSRETAIDALCE